MLWYVIAFTRLAVGMGQIQGVDVMVGAVIGYVQARALSAYVACMVKMLLPLSRLLEAFYMCLVPAVGKFVAPFSVCQDAWKIIESR